MAVSLCACGTFGLWPMPESEGAGNVSVYLCLPTIAALDASLLLNLIFSVLFLVQKQRVIEVTLITKPM